MRVFVAYGYNDRDRWIQDFIFPIIEAFGAEVETGEELQGEQITDVVREKVRRSDALIAFATRRDQLSNGRWTTHRWVTDELATAMQSGLLCVEVRERDVDSQGGIGSSRQLIEYDERERDKCLVELVKTIGKWCREAPVTLQLRSAALVEEVRLRVPRREIPEKVRCTYIVMEGSRQSQFEAKVQPIKGGLFIRVSVPRQAFIQVHVEVPGGKSWSSDFVTIDSFSIDLE